MPITIRQYQAEDKDAVLSLHRAVFEPRSGNNYDLFLEELVHELTAEFCVVAWDDQIIIGAGTYTSLKDAFLYPDDYSLKESLQLLVNFAKDSTQKDALLEYVRYEYGWSKESGIEVEYFQNEYTSKEIIVHDSDFYFSSVVVHPAYRRRRVGIALAKRIIDIARQQGASAIYSSCYESSKSHVMLGKLGFLPLIRVGPKFADGNACVEMRLELQP